MRSRISTIFDRDGRFAYASPSTLQVMGYTTDELLGLDVFSKIDPDDLERVALLHHAHQVHVLLLAPVLHDGRGEVDVSGVDVLATDSEVPEVDGLAG